MEKIVKYLSVIICSFSVYGVCAQTQKIKYEMGVDGYSIHIRSGWNNNIRMPRMSHFSDVTNVIYDTEFNRGIRHNNTILVTGDEPKFALMKYLKQDRLDPDLLKLSNGKFFVTIDGKKHLLHHEKSITVTYKASSTEYSCKPLPALQLKLVISLADDWGAVAKLRIENNSAKAIQIDAGLLFGGMRRCGRTATASYFREKEIEDLQRNILEANGLLPSISSNDFSEKIFIRHPATGKVIIDSLRFLFTNTLELKPKTTDSIYFVFGIASGPREEADILKKVLGAEPESLIDETANYYTSILDSYVINTPSKTLNAGFKTAVLNLDYIHSDSAWLEGVHWWGSYWTNNYQISAATALGQFENAKKALAFFNTAQYGPAPALMRSGKPFVDSLRQGPEDGLPYYIFQLVQYYQSTGDKHFLRQVLPSVAHSIDNLFQLRDPDKNGLLNWHLGANAFMYQADHLGMPGDAASPSLMMAGMLEQLSALATSAGDSMLADKWTDLSRKMYSNLEKLLWNQAEGFFYNHIDLQGRVHSPLYYTDLIFPGLYTRLSDSYSWQTLKYLQDHFFAKDFQGQRNLMKVGILKPSIFGNDNVMPAQMCEAASAFFKQGFNTTGKSLLEAVARAATVFTEAPGNFPERLNDEGKGEANYLFGNPAGSFIHSAINGLFGISLVEGGTTLSWQPAFPDDWDNASLKLPYETVDFKKAKIKSKIILHYSGKHSQSRQLQFSLLVEPFTSLTIECNGKPVKYTTTAQLQKVKISFAGEAALSHTISIQYTPLKIIIAGPEIIFEKSTTTWSGNGEIEEVLDPQQLFAKCKLSKTKIEGVVQAKPGLHQFFVRLKQVPAVISVPVEVKPQYQISCSQALYSLKNEELIIKIQGAFQASKNVKMLTVRLLGKEVNLVLNNKTPFENTVHIKNLKLMPEGVYNIDAILRVNDSIMYERMIPIRLQGMDSATQSAMLNLRRQSIKHIDISKWLNTQTIYAFTFWRNANVVIDSSYFISDNRNQDQINEFAVNYSGNNMAMINYGISDQYTRATRRSEMPESLTIPVNMHGQILSLLFISEMETRLTGSQVGTVNLHFSNGNDSLIFLKAGKNIDAMGGFPFANDIIPIRMKGLDYCKIYDIPIPVSEKLESFTISLTSADVEIGLLGVNIITANKHDSKTK